MRRRSALLALAGGAATLSGCGLVPGVGGDTDDSGTATNQGPPTYGVRLRNQTGESRPVRVRAGKVAEESLEKTWLLDTRVTLESDGIRTWEAVITEVGEHVLVIELPEAPEDAPTTTSVTRRLYPGEEGGPPAGLFTATIALEETLGQTFPTIELMTPGGG